MITTQREHKTSKSFVKCYSKELRSELSMEPLDKKYFERLRNGLENSRNGSINRQQKIEASPNIFMTKQPKSFF